MKTGFKISNLFKIIFFGFTLVICGTKLFSQVVQVPIPKLIESIKPSVVGIHAIDDTVIKITNTDTVRFHNFGSGVLTYIHELIYVLTNEHVIAIKDSLYSTVRYASDLKVILNLKEAGNVSFTAHIYKTDEKSDLAALLIVKPPGFDESLLDAIVISIESWKEPNDLKEGEIIVYCGYPFGWGIKERNNPISRTGIIAQLIPEESTFLIDAFVQPGYSGSPVFVVQQKSHGFPPDWTAHFVGLAQCYPKYFSEVYQEVGLKAIPGYKIIQNPGFSRVIGTPDILRLLGINK